jgi:DNA-directed RNA polymerase specialized sigma subunit
VENVQLSDGEIAELNEAVTRSHSRSNELRAALVKLPPASGTGEFITQTIGREADTDPPDAELARAARSGDSRARETLLERYTPLIVSEARSWIRHSLKELQADFLRPLRLPREALRDLSRLKTERDRISMTEHREPSLRELAERTGIDYERAQKLVRADRRPRGLSEPARAGDPRFGTLGDLLADPLSDADYDEVVDRIAGTQLRALLSRVTEREQEVLAARFGLDGRGPLRRRRPTSTEEACQSYGGTNMVTSSRQPAICTDWWTH